MAKKNLVIVESPAKAKTIEKILGKNYQVVASYGHIRDLPKTKLGIDVKENFKPSYSTIKGKGDVLKKLRDLCKQSNKVYLASDPDREGEAIAWHLANALKLDVEEKNRIEFNEITKKAVKDSIKSARKIDMDKVNSQQARRLLDRLVGYEISPLLWKLISSNTSAGRVQSVALKIICDLEDKIKAFVPEKFWDVKAVFGDALNLVLYKVDTKKITKLMDEEVVKKIEKLKKEDFTVISSKVKNKSKKPPLPLKTSTLQQLASSYLGFSASKTMLVAQKLYEGIEINGEHKGLITYMRTDSTRISDEAKETTRNYIEENLGKEYIGTEVEAKKKQKIQDAHEAVRPTDINLSPDLIEEFLNKEQFKLYKLIWQRFLISQLAAMQYEQFEIICEKDGIEFRGTMNKIIFDGYYKIFKDEEELPLGDFPNIEEGELLKLNKLTIKEDFTSPPSRLTESSLVKTLETEGIGRPSTYASIIDTLKKREYIVMENKSFIPTEIGYEVKTKLEEYFPNILNIKFTAELENELDLVEDGQKDWVNLLSDFYDDLEKHIEQCKKEVQEELDRIVESDVICSVTGKNMLMKNGRFGRYLISPEPELNPEKISLRGVKIPLEDIKAGKIYVKDEVEELRKKKMGQETDMFADDGSKLLLKFGRFGSYLESENFKEDEIRISLPNEIKKLLATNSVTIENGVVKIKQEFEKIKNEEDKLIKEAGKCEKCGKAFKLTRGRWGKFLSCTGYPDCKNTRKLTNKK